MDLITLDKLGFRHLFNCHQVELVQQTVAFDVASLMLYGTEAMPIRLKILLDRLFSVLQHDEVVHVLHGFGWTYEDYSRGYILQNSRGQVLERWNMPTREEEPLILQQFLRFGETKPIAQQLLLQESSERMEQAMQGSKDYHDSDIKRFIQRASRLIPLLPPPPTNLASLPSSAPSVMSNVTNLTSTISRPSKPASSVSSTTSLSPVTRSPVNSPLSSSPLNKLQNMQPYDYRRDRNNSPDVRDVPVMQFPHQSATPLPSPTATTSAAMPPTNLTSSFFSLTTTTLSEAAATSNNSSQLGGVTSDFSITDEGSENDSEAINLSQHSSSLPHNFSAIGHSHLDSIYAAKKVRHLRKSANPMKRRWNPLMLSGLTTNPSTGKKRVQCHVCLKTFCDKGALKIHFSAVHLREMHKCTVDGCNMMFSSRRSRNRHSANPNPKLHTPNLRRKLSHHDGRSSMPFPIIPPSSLMNFSGGSSKDNLLPIPPHVSSDRECEDRRSMSANHSQVKVEANLPSSTMDDLTPDAGISQVGLSFSHRRKSGLNSPDDVLSLTKKSRYELNGDVSNEGDEGIDLSMKDDQNGNSSVNNKGVRKRKSFNPTKCATVTSDDDLQYVSTDDSSSDTFVDDNGLLSKSDDFSSDLLEDDSKDDDVRDYSPLPITSSNPLTSMPMHISRHLPTMSAPNIPKSEEKVEIKSPSIPSFPAPNFSLDRTPPKEEVSSLDLSVKHKEPIIKNNHETEEVSESPLRYLETLSLGAFTGLMNNTKSTFSQHIASTTGISYHAPGLGLASAPSSNIHDISRDRRSHMPLTESQPVSLPIPSSGIGLGSNDSDPDGQMSLLPVYRDASMIGAVDVPVDKENPRRCIACGKIFQNHFGVKTHYQNVHLKLMHKCTVEGCNAAFPSKRSRDRHSANLNLHRKLLSTTADKGHYFDKSSLFPYPHPGLPLRDDYFSRLYDPQNIPLNLYHPRFGEGFLPSPPFANPLGPTNTLGVMNPFHPAFMIPPTSTSSSSLHEGATRISDGRDDTPISSISSTPSPRPKSSSPSSFSPEKDEASRTGRRSMTLDSELDPDGDGRFSCKFCQRLFIDSAHLRDHYEGTHLPSLLPCPIDDCPKAFLSASDRDKHCEAEDHHHHRAKRDKTPPTS
ncbi:zinc finger protein basonuclin-2 [Trichonephila inaurata madagascariensis]|uniref:Zinc finger protein basonuclin-2 n=1 Tax=Trichonephila inaurata madagascariensis TaxID=2747483 RepID=A0A8X7C317_9ARAC|nr:zinc finger protein basonuclin-2 [Trichonephila inaurata madagascariensis]